jgi:hypothetical protein
MGTAQVKTSAEIKMETGMGLDFTPTITGKEPKGMDAAVVPMTSHLPSQAIPIKATENVSFLERTLIYGLSK